MEKAWGGLPYRPISEFYQKHFSGKVYKIPVSVVDDCPNRRGLKGMQTCVFCDQWGSAAQAESITMSLTEQITKYQLSIGQRVNAQNFLVYFQAYTNTFTKLELLRAHFETALGFPFVKGLVIGTRPDCLSKGVLDLWNEIHQRSFVSVELGVQSFFNHHLDFLRRGHSAEQSLKAITRITQATQVDLGIHLMFGMPNETDQEIIDTAKIVNDLPINHIKLHNLHVLSQTPLAEQFKSGLFTPIERRPYAHRVGLFLENLSSRFYIHRLAAHASRWDELIAPDWTSDKMGTHQYLIDHLRYFEIYQGKKCGENYSEELFQVRNRLMNSVITTDQSARLSLARRLGQPESPLTLTT